MNPTRRRFTDFTMRLAGMVLKPAIRWVSSRRLPLLDGIFRIDGLNSPVEVYRDPWGVPHIYADSDHDLFFAQGFVHAQDRFWQMESNRRIASGRLAEVVGPSFVEIDRVARVLGYRRTAAQDLEAAPPDIIAILEAYSGGVNACISGESALPIEFLLLGHKPEPWSPLDSLAYVRLMTWVLSYGWTADALGSSLIAALGPEKAKDLLLSYPASHPSVPDVRYPEASSSRTETERLLPTGGGSNAWAISAERSATGGAVLANDPHLPPRLPSAWYENHLVGGGYAVTGATFPGLPAVIVGHNGDIAWGITVSFAHAQSIVPIRIGPGGDGNVISTGAPIATETIEERIDVKDAAVPVIERVVSTPRGPVVPQIPGPEGVANVLESTALGPAEDVTGFIRLDTARNWDEFRDACEHIRGAHLNFVYADSGGNIGHTISGGLKPRDEPTGEEIAAEDLPHILNPAAGYVISANNRPHVDDYRHDIGSLWIPGYRAMRIEEILADRPQTSIEDSRRAQADLTALSVREIVSLIGNVDVGDRDARFALDELLAWDGAVTANSRPALIFETLRRTLLTAILNPSVPADLVPGLVGEGHHALLAPETEYASHDVTLIARFLADPPVTHPSWLENAGGRAHVIETALRDAVRKIEGTLGPDRSWWHWGALHTLTFRHALGARKPLDWVFDLGPIAMGGNADTPFQASHESGEGFAVTAATQSYRQIVDMSVPGNSLAMHAPGQSGVLGSEHYDDMVEPWVSGEYHPMFWERLEVEAAAAHRLTLLPRPTV